MMDQRKNAMIWIATSAIASHPTPGSSSSDCHRPMAATIVMKEITRHSNDDMPPFYALFFGGQP